MKREVYGGMTALCFCVNGCEIIGIKSIASVITTKSLIEQVYFLIFLKLDITSLEYCKKMIVPCAKT